MILQPVVCTVAALFRNSDVVKLSANQKAPGRIMAAPISWRKTAVFLFISVCVFSLFIVVADCTDTKPKKKKDIRDYNDADMARLLEEWEKDDDIEEGDLPDAQKIHPTPHRLLQSGPSKPEELLMMSRKKGEDPDVVRIRVWESYGEGDGRDYQPVAGKPLQRQLRCSEVACRAVTALQPRSSSCWRCDGSYAWEVKDFLINQDRCEDVTVEGTGVFPGGRSERGQER
ncbi:hypothetical protein NFI96_023402, partial [Prochilodus magdalenae]